MRRGCYLMTTAAKQLCQADLMSICHAGAAMLWTVTSFVHVGCFASCTAVDTCQWGRGGHDKHILTCNRA